MLKEISFPTAKSRELVNITDQVERAVEESGVDEGHCLVFAPHATAAILLNEDEAGFKADVETLLEKWIPKGNWQHDVIDNNATAHLAASMIGQSKVLPLDSGKLQRGTWQEIFFAELDGPRQNRKVIISIIKNK